VLMIIGVTLGAASLIAGAVSLLGLW